jgi:hypothetical protein
MEARQDEARGPRTGEISETRGNILAATALRIDTRNQRREAAALGAADRPGAAADLAKVVSMTGGMRSGASIALLVGVALIQCYATRTGDGCAPLSEHATMAECRKLASEYQKFDTRDLRIKGVPAVVSYHCVTGNAPRSDR